MFRLARLAAACALLALLAPLTASAAERMLVGFQDDPSFRWREDRARVLDEAQAAHAGIMRTTVYWSRIAPTRPASATSPFDPAYRFDDLDEFVRAATLRGSEVMLTIWGTPGWANGGKGQNFAPTNMGDLQNFARALATRYSGRLPGYPFVRYYTVWNESNLGQFLSPQYNSKGKPVAQSIYARLYRAAYAGIKLGNRLAKVGIGETSARGRDFFLGRKGTQETQSPGKFAELLAQQRPALRFDAWSHHPYPVSPNLPPLAKVRWPNVTLTQLERFEKSLDQWFKRKNIPIWITEYAHETRPGEPKGVTFSQQAQYARQALNYVRQDPRVTMFIWFILRDDPTSAWQSGLIQLNNRRKPGFNAFSAVASQVDGRNPMVAVKAGTNRPVIRVPVMELYGRAGAGTIVGINAKVYHTNSNPRRQRLIEVGASQPQTRIGFDGTITFRAPIRVRKDYIYRVDALMKDVNGNSAYRLITIVAR